MKVQGAAISLGGTNFVVVLVGMELVEAVRLGGVRRFRPIMLTSLTTFFGLVPLMLDNSQTSQFLIPMAVSISYGIMVATLLTLVMLPLLLSIGNKSKVYFQWLQTGNKPTEEEVERAIIEQKNEEKEEEKEYEIA